TAGADQPKSVRLQGIPGLFSQSHMHASSRSGRAAEGRRGLGRTGGGLPRQCSLVSARAGSGRLSVWPLGGGGGAIATLPPDRSQRGRNHVELAGASSG